MAALLQSLNITSTGTDTQIYQVPSGKTSSFSLNVQNRTAGNVKVRIAISSASTPTVADYIEYDATILPGENLQRLGLVLGNQNYVFVRTDTLGVNAVIFGFEE